MLVFRGPRAWRLRILNSRLPRVLHQIKNTKKHKNGTAAGGPPGASKASRGLQGSRGLRGLQGPPGRVRGLQGASKAPPGVSKGLQVWPSGYCRIVGFRSTVGIETPGSHVNVKPGHPESSLVLLEDCEPKTLRADTMHFL